MPTGATAQETASRRTSASATYQVNIVNGAGSQLATGQLAIDSNSDNTLTASLALVDWPLIPLSGIQHNVGAVFPTVVLSLAGTAEGVNCGLVLEQVSTPLPTMCGIVVLTQNGATTLGVVLFQPPS